MAMDNISNTYNGKGRKEVVMTPFLLNAIANFKKVRRNNPCSKITVNSSYNELEIISML